MTYLILFITAFISATLFPLGSEALLIYDINLGHNIYLLLFFATLGNSLGSVVNYFLGLKGEEYLVDKKNDREKKQNFSSRREFSELLDQVKNRQISIEAAVDKIWDI